MKRNFQISDNGSITTIVARTKKAEKWIAANLQLESW